MIAFSEDPEEQLFKVYSKKSFDDSTTPFLDYNIWGMVTSNNLNSPFIVPFIMRMMQGLKI